MNLRLLTITLLIILLSSMTVIAQSDDDARIQEFFSAVNEDNEDFFVDLFGMDEGDTIYVYAESYDVDTFVGICDIDCEIEIYEFNNDIDGRRNRNSAFEYTFEEDGDYSIFVSDCCDSEAEGVVRLLIGLEAPEVLTGEAFPTGDPFAVIYQPNYIDLSEQDFDEDDEQAQQFYGEVTEDAPFAFYEIEDAEEGQTLYVYAESYDIDTAIGVCYETCEELLIFEDNISDGDSNTALEYTFEDDGDYRVIVGDCCDLTVEGEFRVVMGYNAPEILKDSFLPNGAQIVTPYVTPTSFVQSEIDRDEEIINENCEDVDLNDRPELSGDEETVETEHFIIHYTEDGDDEADDDFVDEVVEIVEEIYERQVEELGWAAPPLDCGEGGDARYDFYLMNILDEDGILGYAQPEELIGDNPFSDEEEEWAAYGYMVIDNDYDGVPSPLVVMRATVAHEFHHLIQFGYDLADDAFWIYEATASWMETVTSGEEDATGYVRAVFDEPDLCIGTRDDRTGLRVYGEWLLIDSLAQDFGQDSIITLWEIIAEEEGMDAFYEFIDEMDSTPEEVLRHYAIRNLLLDYELGNEFRDTVDVEEVIDDFDDYDSGRDGIQEMAVQYLFIREDDEYTFELDNDDLTMVLVGIDEDDEEVDVFELGTEGSVDTDPYDYSYLIIMNLNQHDDPDDCEEEDWELEVREWDGEDFAEPNGEEFDVDNFDPAD